MELEKQEPGRAAARVAGSREKQQHWLGLTELRRTGPLMGALPRPHPSPHLPEKPEKVFISGRRQRGRVIQEQQQQRQEPGPVGVALEACT